MPADDGRRARPAGTRRGPARRRRRLVAIADHSLLIAAAIAFAAPLVFIVLTSLMTTDQALSTSLWPEPFKWSNYTDVFEQAPMFRYALNTMLYAVARRVLMLSRASRWRTRSRGCAGRAATPCSCSCSSR